MNPYTKMFAALFATLAMIAAGMLTYVVMSGADGRMSYLSSFTDRDALEDFVQDASREPGYMSWRNASLAPTGGDAEGQDGVPHSTTNIQVAGVDEEDIVKTDGTYLFISSWDKVSIIKAYPPAELANVSVIYAKDLLGFEAENISLGIHGLFLGTDRLVVVAELYTFYTWWYERTLLDSVVEFDWEPPRTIVAVFDLEDIQSPELLYTVGVTGNELTSRMIGDHVYLVAQSYAWIVDEELAVPEIWVDGVSHDFRIDSIYYDPDTTQAESFVNLLAVDITSGDHSYLSVVAGYASTIYMSQSALYFTVAKWEGGLILAEDGEVAEEEDSTTTSIYRISIDGLDMIATARGDVRGWLLNQFSIDEREPYLRVATTTSWSEPENDVYVLGPDLSIVGALKGLAPTERIFAARFIGDTLYLVTFRQIDPLFVIDLSVPQQPRVVGELKIPGFSSYLHPVDEDHVLGIGSENGSMKISLFDVSDPSNPSEMSTYISDDYTWSLALYDHKAILFDREKELLVVPASSYGYEDTNWTYWYKSGAYVFRVSVTDGISLRGIIEHEEKENNWYGDVQRSLYIGEFLYTVSYYSVKVSSLDDLSAVGFLWFSSPWWLNYGAEDGTVSAGA